jgi:hypothetical protein
MIRAAVDGKVFIKFGDPEMERQRNELLRGRYEEKTNREERERLRAELGPVADAPRTGLTSEEIRDIIANSARKPTQDDGQIKDVRTDGVHDRGDGGKPPLSITRW